MTVQNRPPDPAPIPPDQAKRMGEETVDQILSQSAMDALLGVQEDDLIAAAENPEVIKGTENGSGCWYHSPGRLELFAAADKRLTRIAALDGIRVTRVDRVIAKLIKDTSLLVLKATTSDNLRSIPVNRWAGKTSASVNVVTLTGPAGLTVETGYRVLYDVAYVPKASPLWPALVIDLSKPLERRAKKKRANKQQNTNSQTTPAEVAAAEDKPSA